MRAIAALPALLSLSLYAAGPGIFEDHGDVGTVLHAGSVEYDASARTYTVAGSGENMWFASDAFQFVWKKASGDVMLTADISFVGAGKEAHRKAVLMIRQSLDADSAYADIARHGDGLTSLQARDRNGANTSEVQTVLSAPARVRIIKRGNVFYFSAGAAGQEPRFAGGALRVAMQDPFYVGIGVCSHNKDVSEKAVFSNVELSAPPAASPVLYSVLETVPVSGDRRAIFVTPGRISAPQWTAAGDALLFQRGDRVERVPAAGGLPVMVPSDHPQPAALAHLSPDGQQLAFLAPAAGQDTLLRLVSLRDNQVKVVATLPGDAPGGLAWSPDSRRLALISYYAVPEPDPGWGPLQFLIGKWTGEGAGEPGNSVGSFSLLPDLQGRVLVRRGFAEYPPAGGKPAFRHDDLMLISRSEESGDLRATYWDSEGHAISYSVLPVEHGAQLVSDGPADRMRYRLTYLEAGKDRIRLTFEISPPGRDFVQYLDASLRRQQ